MPATKATILILTLISLVMAYLPQATAQSEPKLPASAVSASATELAKQVASAYGGMLKIKERLSRGCRSHGNLKSLSTISSAANDFECEFVSKGDKIRIEMEFLGQTKIETFNGKTGWTRSGDWVSRTDSKTVERIAEELRHGLNALGKLDDFTCKLELLPGRQIKGNNCDVLKLSLPDGKWTVLYVDSHTHLVLRSEFTGLDSEQGVEALKTTDYSDYRNILGFPTPFKMEEYVAGKKSQEATLTGVTIDDSISDSFFDMPEESRYTRLDLGPSTIPFEYAGNYIVITARINKGSEAKFVIDTGSSHTVIDKSSAQLLGPITTHTFSVTTLAKALPLGYAKLDSIQIGDLNIENIPALITDLSTLSAPIGQRPAGLIGADILERFLLTIDFQDKKLTLSDPHNVSVPAEAIVVPAYPVFASTALIVAGVLDSKPMNFLVDTGAAFNLLPAYLAEAFNPGATLPVGQISGLEGLKTSIGSIKLKSLKLGAYTVYNPVFNIQPEKGGKGSQGLGSANSMGLIGNPLWSKTKLSIDYRNNRLLIEIPPDRLKLDSFLEEIYDNDRAYLRNKNSDAAATAYAAIMTKAQTAQVRAAEAMALARISGLYADRFSQTKESRWLDMAAGEYEKAAKLAADSRNKSIEAQIFAQWALFYLNFPRSATDLVSAQNLLKKALARDPMDAGIYAALGSAMLKTGKSPLGIKFIDQALMLDPANWQALQEKYKLFQAENKRQDMKLVLTQMARYYPDFPQVKELAAGFEKGNAKAAPADKSSKVPARTSPARRAAVSGKPGPKAGKTIK